MATQKKQSKGTADIAIGGATTAYGVAHAPILRGGSKDISRMVNASPKKQGSRYQAELHQAMKSGRVATDSPVHVLRTPSGRHINAGGTHRQIAREAMGKPSEYQVKNIGHEIHTSPYQAIKGRLRVANLARGSKKAEAGRTVKPVDPGARALNRVKAAHADVADAAIWKNPSAIEHGVKLGRKAGLISSGITAGIGAAGVGLGLHERKQWNKAHGVSKRSVSAFGVDHGMAF